MGVDSRFVRGKVEYRDPPSHSGIGDATEGHGATNNIGERE